MEQFVELFSNVANFTWQQLLMIAIGATLIYLAIKKGNGAHASFAHGLRRNIGQFALCQYGGY